MSNTPSRNVRNDELTRTILLVCLHRSAKSLIAGEHLNPLAALACGVLLSAPALAPSPTTLRLIGRVPMPTVEGRIDHMAIDVAGQRLFVAALGNNTLEVIDVRNAKRVRTIAGAHEPQGIAYGPSTNRIYVGNRADGFLRIFDGTRIRRATGS